MSIVRATALLPNMHKPAVIIVINWRAEIELRLSVVTHSLPTGGVDKYGSIYFAASRSYVSSILAAIPWRE